MESVGSVIGAQLTWIEHSRRNASLSPLPRPAGNQAVRWVEHRTVGARHSRVTGDSGTVASPSQEDDGYLRGGEGALCCGGHCAAVLRAVDHFTRPALVPWHVDTRLA